jgi:DNA-3-methyladenine glycosylase II
VDVERLTQLPDEKFIAELTAVPGIGPWTAQGALLVALRQEDVVLPGDLALRKAVRAAYHLDHLLNQDEVLAIAEKWRPYRSLATSYLFRRHLPSGRRADNMVTGHPDPDHTLSEKFVDDSTLEARR